MTTKAAALTGFGISGVAVLAATLIMPFEGYHPKAYLDPPGIATICWGHTGNVKLGQTKTEDQCIELLAFDVMRAENAVNKALTVQVPSSTKAAIVSFTYNVGSGNLNKSTMLRMMNAGNIRQGCNELNKWVYAGGVKLPGLVARRKAEYAMCIKDLP